MSMRFTEIGQQLRAFRLESGLRAEEIAARLGVSRAALYRYEKGEVIKLDTVKRLAELLNLSPLTLLGIGVEYYSRPIAYFERLRQTEETADQVLEVLGPLCYLTTTDAYDAVLANSFEEAAGQAGSDRAEARHVADQILGTLGARKRMYAARRPGIICMVPVSAVRRLLEHGVAEGLATSATLRARARQIAEAEVRRMTDLMEAEPIGLQFGLIEGAEPNSLFTILRARDQVSLAINPFRPDGNPRRPGGVAMLTSADEAVKAHQSVAEAHLAGRLEGGGRSGPPARDSPLGDGRLRPGVPSPCRCSSDPPRACPPIPTCKSKSRSASGTADSRLTACAFAIAVSTARCRGRRRGSCGGADGGRRCCPMTRSGIRWC